MTGIDHEIDALRQLTERAEGGDIPRQLAPEILDLVNRLRDEVEKLCYEPERIYPGTNIADIFELLSRQLETLDPDRDEFLLGHGVRLSYEDYGDAKVVCGIMANSYHRYDFEWFIDNYRDGADYESILNNGSASRHCRLNEGHYNMLKKILMHYGVVNESDTWLI